MKLLLKNRFYISAAIGLFLMFFNINNAFSNFKMILWALGLLISFVSVLLQIFIDPKS